MKFGGTSVADPQKIKDVARRIVAAREAGNRVVAVLSAMGDTTDDLVRLAYEISADPKPRELDMVISVGERISCALCAMAIHDLGHEAISLTGSQAGIVTDTTRGRATRPPGAEAARGQLRRDAGDGRLGRARAPAALGRVRAQPQRQAARPVELLRGRRHLDSRGGRTDAREGPDLRRDAHGGRD